jgi:outer membrane receptor for ferrienterochelin and colicin
MRKNSRADYNHATYPERFAEPEGRVRVNLFLTSPLVPIGVEMKISRLAIPAAMLRSCAQRFCLGAFAAGMMAVGTAAELPGDEFEHGVSLSSLADFDLETLLNMEVTLVSKKEQRLFQSAAAVSVISQEELRRSGATSLAESLRSVPGIEVGRLDSHTWAITARGFNEAFANKLLVMMDVQHRFPLGERHEITWGTGYRLLSDAIESTFNFEVMRPQRDLQLFGEFVQDAVELIEDRLTLTLGSKVEHNDFTGVEFQPSGRLAWTPHPRHTVWVSASRAVRTPSRVEVNGRLSIEGNYTLIEELFPFLSNLYGSVQGNPEFASENLHAFEMGYRVQPHRRLTLDAAVFCNVYDDLRTGELGTPLFEALPAPHFNLTARNNMSGETYGAELAAKWQMVDWWRTFDWYGGQPRVLNFPWSARICWTTGIGSFLRI